MKGVVLSGGKGSRLRPFTYSGAKQLVPIANTPVLHFPIRQLVEAGITDIAIVVGDTGSQIREAMGDGSTFGARLTYLEQPGPLGVAHAVGMAEAFVGDDAFVVYLGDNVLHGGIVDFVDDFRRGSAGASLVLKEVEDPRAFGVADLEGERLLRVIEKPENPPTNFAVIGVYAFRPAVFDVIRRQKPSGRNELEIADSINGLITDGHEVRTLATPAYWIDTGKMEDMLQANAVVLGSLERSIDPTASISSSDFDGAVVIGAGARVEQCRIRPPVAIGEGAVVRGAIVGPNVAIGPRCDVDWAYLSNSIVMSDSVLKDCNGIRDSMIGRFCRVTNVPKGSRLTLGDHSCVDGTP